MGWVPPRMQQPLKPAPLPVGLKPIGTRIEALELQKLGLTVPCYFCRGTGLPAGKEMLRRAYARCPVCNGIGYFEVDE